MCPHTQASPDKLFLKSRDQPTSFPGLFTPLQRGGGAPAAGGGDYDCGRGVDKVIGIHSLRTPPVFRLAGQGWGA